MRKLIVLILLCLNISVYGITSGPDGTVYSGHYTNEGNYISYINSDNSTGTFTAAGDYRTLTTDNYTLYPNTLTSKLHYHLIASMSEAGYFQDYTVNNYAPIHPVLNDDTVIQIQSDTTLSNFGGMKGIGLDGENNIWGVGGCRAKTYRVKNGSTFPYEGYCRYPTSQLGLYPTNYLNTTEIEWFLLRDSGYENSTTGVSAIGSLDNTHTTTFAGITGMTAHKAWWSLIEDQRFEINPIANSGTYVKSPSGDINAYKSVIGQLPLTLTLY